MDTRDIINAINDGLERVTDWEVIDGANPKTTIIVFVDGREFKVTVEEIG